MKDTLPSRGLDSTRSSSLPLRHGDEHLTCFAETLREREKGHLVGRMDGEGVGAGGRARRRSSRQLLGHCLPGVCTSVISQPLSSLASYDTRTHTSIHTLTQTHPNTDSARAPPSLSCLCLRLPCSDSVEQVRFIEAQALYIDTVTSCQHLQAASLSFFDG